MNLPEITIPDLDNLPEGDEGDLALIIRMLIEERVVLKRTRILLDAMHKRGMFDNVDLRDIIPGGFLFPTEMAAYQALTTERPQRAKLDDQHYLNSKEACQYMGMKVKNPSCTMSRLVKARKLPYRIKTNKLVFTRVELDEYMKSRSWHGRGRPPGSKNKSTPA